jgi:hypothetical protein
MILDWIYTAIEVSRGLWDGTAPVLLNLLGALIAIVFGLIFASGISTIFERIVKVLKIDDLLQKLGIEEHFERAGLKLDASRFFGRIVYWFVVIVALLVASEILGLFTLASFLKQVLLYVPNVIVAALIMVAAIVIANFLKGLITASVRGARLHSPSFVGSITWWAIVVFGFLAALSQLGVAVSIINSLVTGFIAMLALAGGIAFGLGGKGVAEDILEHLRGHVSDER